MEQPVFGVQAGLVERTVNLAAGLGLQEFCEGGLVQAQAAPLDEEAEQIDPLGGADLVNQCLPCRCSQAVCSRPMGWAGELFRPDSTQFSLRPLKGTISAQLLICCMAIRRWFTAMWATRAFLGDLKWQQSQRSFGW
jgi:hypothetical protein